MFLASFVEFFSIDYWSEWVNLMLIQLLAVARFWRVTWMVCFQPLSQIILTWLLKNVRCFDLRRSLKVFFLISIGLIGFIRHWFNYKMSGASNKLPGCFLSTQIIYLCRTLFLLKTTVSNYYSVFKCSCSFRNMIY